MWSCGSCEQASRLDKAEEQGKSLASFKDELNLLWYAWPSLPSLTPIPVLLPICMEL